MKKIVLGIVFVLAAAGVIWSAAGFVKRITPDYARVETRIGAETAERSTEEMLGETSGGGENAGPEGEENHLTIPDTEAYAESRMEEQTEPQTEPIEPEPVKLLFGGDVYLSDHVLNAYSRAGGIGGVLDEGYREKIGEADIFMVNQEFPFSSRGTAADKTYTFRLPPEKVSMFHEMGIDIVTLANNHTLDFGREALEDTCAALEGAGIPYVGAGRNLERAKQLEVLNVRGTRIGFLGASRVVPFADWTAGKDTSGLFLTYDPAQLLEEIKAAKEACDYLVVYVHWGIERNDKPEGYQKTMGRQYIDAGADLVLGSHPHVLQGIEFYNGKPIVYSLGNFVFGSSIPKTMLVQVEVDGDQAAVSVIPGTSGSGFTQMIGEEGKKQEFYRYLEGISFGVSIGEDGTVQEGS